MATSVEDIRKAQRAEGVATILGIGTANPLTCFYQNDFPEFYFRVTKSEHMSDLKDKFKRICDNTMIEKRHFVLSEDKLHENPSICAYMESSLDRRLDIAVPEVVRLGQEAALKAIKEWGQPKYMISHLIFCTVCNVDMPGADYQLIKLLGLRPSVKRFMLSQLGCYAGGTVLRLAKDIAENNKGSRVLVVCSETNAICFRGPTDTNHQDSMMVGHALFGDGSGAMIIGADPNLSLLERPIFEIVWTAQTILPESEGTLCGHLRETGLIFNISDKIPGLISNNIHMVLEEAFTPLGISDWNSIFWIAHPGGPAIFHQVEDMLGLEPEKLKASRAVLNKYGNMWSACVLFILDEMRNKSLENGFSTTGEGLEWGILFGFGPGLTVETVVLHSVPVAVTK